MSAPDYPLKVIKQDTLRQLVGEMNGAQAVAVAVMPRFGLEITVADGEFQVQVSELDTGHDIRLSRDVAQGMIDALSRLVEKIDEHVAANPALTQDDRSRA